MDEFDKNDPVWDLLGEARRTEASPWFAGKVLRAVRATEEKPSFSLSSLWRWLIPASAFAAVAIGWSIHVQQEHQRELAEFNEYFDSAAELSSLVAMDVSQYWEDAN